MKKSLKIAVLFLLIANITIAQETSSSRQSIQLGVKAGLNYSSVYDTKGDQFSSNAIFGFAGGAFLSIPLGTVFGLQPEFLFSQKGFKGSGYLIGSQYSFT